MPLQQTTFEKIVAKREIAHTKRFRLLPVIILSCIEVLHFFQNVFTLVCYYIIICCVWEMVNPPIFRYLDTTPPTTFENIVAKVKLLIMSNFTICHNVFNTIFKIIELSFFKAIFRIFDQMFSKLCAADLL